MALKHLDEIVSLIRSAPDAEQARLRLIKRYDLTEIQASAILEMQLRRIASLERKKIEEEYKAVVIQIKDLESLLASPKRMREVVEEELKAVRQKYGDRRRTQIVALKEGTTATQFLTASDLTPDLVVWVGVTADGKIARSHSDAMPDLSGEGNPRWLIHTTTRHNLYLCNTHGQAAAVAVTTLPEGETFANGVPLYKASSLGQDDRLAAMFAISPDEAGAEKVFILAATRQGMVKKSVLADLPGPSAQKFTLLKVAGGDELINAFTTDGTNEIGLVTAKGLAIRFFEEEVRAIGLVAAGVMGIKLGEGDVVVSALRWSQKADLLLAVDDGTALRVSAADFSLQGRYGGGVIAVRLTPGTRIVSALIGVKSTALLVQIEAADPRKAHIGDVPMAKRAAKTAVLLPLLKGGGRVTGVIDLGDDGKPAKARAKTTPGSGKSGKPVPKADSKQKKLDAVPEGPVKSSPGGKKSTAAGKKAGSKPPDGQKKQSPGKSDQSLLPGLDQ